MPTMQIMAKDHDDNFTTKIIEASTLYVSEKRAIIIAKCHARSYKSLA
jgi:hypothetical protein